MSSLTHVHPGEAITVHATPEDPKRVSVPGGEVYYDGATLEGKSHKFDGSVVITETSTFLGGSVVSVESKEDGVVQPEKPKKKAPRKPRPSEVKAAKKPAKKKAPAKKPAAKKRSKK